MNQIQNIGLKLWLSVCLIGSIIYGVIFISWFNLIDNFDNLEWLEILFVIFILLILSIVFSMPYILYLKIRKQMTKEKILNSKESNIIFFLYSLFLYFFTSNQTMDYIEAFKLIITYFVLGEISLNYYLKIEK
ncbi:MAG: hypothetical protein ACI9XP_001982 [Lentimonas sp.]|jgi:hypothetical protein